MSRIASGDVVRVAPQNNVYTAMAAAAFLVTLIATILVFLKAQSVLGGQLFQG